MVVLIAAVALAGWALWRGTWPAMGAAGETVAWRIRIENRAGGVVSVTSPGGTSEVLGRVVEPATAVGTLFGAARWGEDGSVVATAANALHVRTPSVGEMRPVGFSIIPQAIASGGPGPYRWRHGAAMVVSCSPAEGLFGRRAPPVGTQVLLERDGEALPLPLGYVPGGGEVLVVVGAHLPHGATEAVIENRTGGSVLVGGGRRWRTVGRVLHPVAGVGRFPSTVHVGRSCVAANHPGVITVATSPVGQVGGFQVVPAEHAGEQSPEMGYARCAPQWLVIASAGAGRLAGQEPLFCGRLRPRAAGATDAGRDARASYAGLVEVRRHGGDWETMPEVSVGLEGALTPTAAAALADVSHIRLHLK